MARVTAERVLDERCAGRRYMAPRRGLVLETLQRRARGWDLRVLPSGRGASRLLQADRRGEPLGAGQYKARQVVELKVGLPWWSWLLALAAALFARAGRARKAEDRDRDRGAAALVGAAATAR